MKRLIDVGKFRCSSLNTAFANSLVMKIITFPATFVLGMMAMLTISGCNQHRRDNAAPAEQPKPQTEAIAGVTFYYGVVKGGALKSHPAAHSEASMHKGRPISATSYHIVLTLFETATNKRITDARVAVRVARSIANASTWLPMDAMRDAGSESFGRYAELPNPGTYLIEFQVNRKGRANPVTARFAFERPE